jgi:hypothetical protein
MKTPKIYPMLILPYGAVFSDVIGLIRLLDAISGYLSEEEVSVWLNNRA